MTKNFPKEKVRGRWIEQFLESDLDGRSLLSYDELANLLGVSPASVKLFCLRHGVEGKFVFGDNRRARKKVSVRSLRAACRKAIA